MKNLSFRWHFQPRGHILFFSIYLIHRNPFIFNIYIIIWKMSIFFPSKLSSSTSVSPSSVNRSEAVPHETTQTTAQHGWFHLNQYQNSSNVPKWSCPHWETYEILCYASQGADPCYGCIRFYWITVRSWVFPVVFRLVWRAILTSNFSLSLSLMYLQCGQQLLTEKWDVIKTYLPFTTRDQPIHWLNRSMMLMLLSCNIGGSSMI